MPSALTWRHPEAIQAHLSPIKVEIDGLRIYCCCHLSPQRPHDQTVDHDLVRHTRC
jgi:hypothetical protein